MAREYIKDYAGKVIGYYDTDARGEITLRDFYGRLKGRYDPKTNTTKDFYGRFVGKGNLLMLLLKD